MLRNAPTVALALSLLPAFLSAASAAPVTYTVIKGSALNLMTAESKTTVENFTARTADVTGTVTYDADARVGSGTVIVNGASIQTGIAGRDSHMKSADWLNFDKLPTVTFKTTSVKYVSGDSYDVSGTLTLNGVTRPFATHATVKLTPAGAATKQAGAAGDALALTTSFPVKLSDYGVKNGQIGGRVSDTLTINLRLLASN